MRLSHAKLRRHICWLAIALAILTVPALTACSSAAQPVSDQTTGNAETHASASAVGQPHEAAPHQPRENMIPADAVSIKLPIVGRATTLNREDLRVSQGDTVHLLFTTDEPGEIHLHGYDLIAEVSPEHPGELIFVAHTAGAFGINFHVFASESMGDNHNGTDAPELVESESPLSVAITAEPDADGGVSVSIMTVGFRFAPELVDHAHTEGVGHAHIYVDGEKLARVFEPYYQIDDLPPGDHEIRVSLNSNNHGELAYDGKKLEATATVIVPDVGQGHGNHGEDSSAAHGHGGEQETVAEVHLGNLEVYP